MKTNKLTALLCASLALSFIALAACKEEDGGTTNPPAQKPDPTPTTAVLTLSSGEYGFDEDDAFIESENADGCTITATEYSCEETDGLYTYILQIDAKFETAGRYFFVSDYAQTFGDENALVDSSLYETKSVYTCLTTTANETDTFYIRIESMYDSESYEYELIYLPTQTAVMGENRDKEMSDIADWEFKFTAPKAGLYQITPAANNRTMKLGVAGDGTYVDYISHTNNDGALIVTATEDNQTLSFFALSDQEKASFTITEYVPEKFPAQYVFNRQGEDVATLDIAVKAGGSTNIIVQDLAIACQLSWTDESLSYRFNGLEITDTSILFVGKTNGTHTLTVVNSSASDCEQTLTLALLTEIPVGTSTIYLPSANDNRQFTLDVRTESAMQLTVDETVAAIYKNENTAATSSLIINPVDGTVSVQIVAKSTNPVVTQITFDAPNEA